MSANDIQVGGDHYKKREYQHWDWVSDIGLHYLLGCASKYVSRWRDKNGRQDLEKALHYLAKARERNVLPPQASAHARACTSRFVSGLADAADGSAIWAMTRGDYTTATTRIEELLNSDAEVT